MPFLDTNIFLSYFLKDQNYVQARQLLTQSCYLNDAVIIETTNFLQNKHSAYAAFQALNFLYNTPELFQIIPLDSTHRQLAQKIMSQYLDSKFSFVDCLILSQAEFNNLPLLSTDQRLQTYKKVKTTNPFLA